ncbi:hypothetical protein ETD83_08060 [Actinomadura soli]|uniref:Uncharacterized protein n=1 Tax=Actinomadura soli TaxID=2508997 RepID=A0A5C4JH92_9ACTN|nr:hypothetical protein [Actinomadura soli]TMR04730.1 hypothetical protein ETD83_08060 [Actinomadura soli]
MDELAEAATIIQAVTVILGILFAIMQLRQVSLARNLETMKSLFDGFAELSSYAERKAILDTGPVEPQTASEQDLLLYARHADFFHSLGFHSRNKFVSRRYLLELYSGGIISMWQCLEPFVQYMRDEKGVSNYSHDFEALAAAAQAYRAKNFPSESLRWAAGSEPG